VPLGVLFDDLGCRGLNTVAENRSQSQASTWGVGGLRAPPGSEVVIDCHRVVVADLATVKGMTSDQVALQFLPAAVADHQSGQRVARRYGPPYPAMAPALGGSDGFGAGVGRNERRNPVPGHLIDDGVICLYRCGDPLGPILPLLLGHMAKSWGIRIEETSAFLVRPDTW